MAVGPLAPQDRQQNNPAGVIGPHDPLPGRVHWISPITHFPPRLSHVSEALELEQPNATTNTKSKNAPFIMV